MNLGAEKITLENISDFLSSRPKSAIFQTTKKEKKWLLKVADSAIPSALIIIIVD